MDLKQYIAPMSLEQRQAFAKRCGTSAGYLIQLAGRHRKPSPTLAVTIERETKGAISCEELLPDMDWAYLRTRKRAGKIVSA